MKNPTIEKAISLLISNSSPLDRDVQERVIRESFDVFYYIKNTMYYVNGANRMPITTHRDFKAIMKIIFSDVNIEDLPTVRELYSSIMFFNSVSEVKMVNDIFGKNHIELDRNSGILYIYTNKLSFNSLDDVRISQVEQDEIVRDFKSHFPQFREVLEFIAYSRVASDRKASWLYLLAGSSFGKSFFAGVLKKAIKAVEVNYNEIAKTDTSPINPSELQDSMCFVIDEFTTFTQQMKRMSFEYTLAPKYGMRQTVPLYAKILMSAELSSSLSGAVDKQIKERVAFIEPKTKIELYNREVYKKYGNSMYLDTLSLYAQKVIRGIIEDLMRYDRYEAMNKADEYIRTFVKKHQLDTIDINIKIQSIVKEELSQSPLPDNTLYVNSGANKGKFLIKRYKKTIEAWLKEELDDNEFKKVRFKISDLENILGGEYKAVKINGKTEKGLVVDRDELLDEFVTVVDENTKEVSYLNRSEI